MLMYFSNLQVEEEAKSSVTCRIICLLCPCLLPYDSVPGYSGSLQAAAAAAAGVVVVVVQPLAP